MRTATTMTMRGLMNLNMTKTLMMWHQMRTLTATISKIKFEQATQHQTILETVTSATLSLMIAISINQLRDYPQPLLISINISSNRQV